jgi:hypothetical protein
MNLPKGYRTGFNGVSSILGSHDQVRQLLLTNNRT